jgi:hypothetical protein
MFCQLWLISKLFTAWFSSHRWRCSHAVTVHAGQHVWRTSARSFLSCKLWQSIDYLCFHWCHVFSESKCDPFLAYSTPAWTQLPQPSSMTMTLHLTQWASASNFFLIRWFSRQQHLIIVDFNSPCASSSHCDSCFNFQLVWLYSSHVDRMIVVLTCLSCYRDTHQVTCLCVNLKSSISNLLNTATCGTRNCFIPMGKPSPMSMENLHPWTRARVLAGAGAGCRKKP